ncbi:hypothetical protein P167DRAFT_531474, partial [Morchella conica CCBAS932]
MHSLVTCHKPVRSLQVTLITLFACATAAKPQARPGTGIEASTRLSSYQSSALTLFPPPPPPHLDGFVSLTDGALRGFTM